MGSRLNIIVTRKDGTTFPMESRKDVTHISSGKQTMERNSTDTVSITVESAIPQSYDIGDSINVFGRDYRLNRLPKVRKSGQYAYTYDLEFEGVQYDLMRVNYELSVNTTSNELQDVSGDSLTGDIKSFMDVVIANANRVFGDGKWSWEGIDLPALGDEDYIGDKTLTFGEDDNCLSSLQTICSEENFNLTFTVETTVVDGDSTYRILLRKASTTEEPQPWTYRYGRNLGLYEIQRENVSSANLVTRLKAYGSTENITYKYKADRLCLPGATGKSDSYIQSAEGIEKYGIFEGRKNFDDIKPTYTGTVTRVEKYLTLFDEDFPFDLNATDSDGNTLYLIDGLEAKIHFNSGNLAGYEFTIKSYDHSTHMFIVNKFIDDRGETFPSEDKVAFSFAQGDTYKITDIAYPDDITEAAENNLLDAAKEYLKQYCQPLVQYGISVTTAWLEEQYGVNENEGVVNIYAVGNVLHVYDEEIGVDKNIPLKSFERDILDVYSYSLTLSDIPSNATIVTKILGNLRGIDNTLTINNLKDPAVARANWRSSREVLDMVFDPDGNYYSEKIAPNSVDTLMLSVGAKSMQFSLVGTTFQPNYGGNPNSILWTGGTLVHYTIDEDGARYWQMSDAGTNYLSSSTAYYIYAVCERNGDTGYFTLTTATHTVEESNTQYYFLVGILNSVDPDTNVRTIALMYGFTTINGRFIKTGRIESADGGTYFDLDTGEISGRITFTQGGSTTTLEELGGQTYELGDYVQNTLQTILQNLQDQIDGVVEQYFETYDPTTENYPASEWTTEQDKKKHLGDLFYNTDTGKVWRFVINADGDYAWVQLSDEELSQALQIANDALALAKEKRRIFTSQPYTPYDAGDLWVAVNLSGTVSVCVQGRQTGSFNSSDWQLADGYLTEADWDNFLTNDYTSLLSQVDGKIETWFQNVEPDIYWSSKERSQHVGDLWYCPSEQLLFIYTQYTDEEGDVLYDWELVEDADAVDAYKLASQAQDTADGKRQVFITVASGDKTPTPPYDVGDLWILNPSLVSGASDDSGEVVLWRCVNAKKSGQTYELSDWVTATSYDNTTTVIDGGVVTTGLIQIAGEATKNKDYIVAGISGRSEADVDTKDVRFWSGAGTEQRSAAPFRVLHDGSLYATMAYISGDSTVEGRITATSGKIAGFTLESSYMEASVSDTTMTLSNYRIQFENASGLNIVLGKNTAAYSDIFYSLGITSPWNGGTYNGYSASSYAGNVGIRLNVSGATPYDNYVYSGNHALYIDSGDICGFRLRVRNRTTTGQVLSDMDSVIIGTGGITLYLPDVPQRGQIYFVLRGDGSSSGLTIRSNSQNINLSSDGSLTYSVTIYGSMAMFVYSGTYWFARLLSAS